MADTWQAISGYASNNYSDTMVFEVDGATKKLQKISGQTLIAGEKNSQYIRFMMPRYWDGIDVSEKTISIIYGLAGQYYGETAAISAERTDDSLRFGWVVPEEACCIAGTLLFVLVIKDSTYVLKSQITEVPVLKSINLDDVIPEPTKEAWYADFQVRVERTLSAAENAVEEAQSTLAQARSLIGSPLVANTAADMTETSRIYVYTGSETGYTNGHWYYHNGSAWTDGGVYNAVAVDTDTTLTIAGKPADSKKTGDEISQIKEDLNDVETSIGDLSNLTTSAKENLVAAINEAAQTGSGGTAQKSLPKLYINGDISQSNKDAETKAYNYVFVDEDGKRHYGFNSLKWQGESSLLYPKKNYTLKFYHDALYIRKDKVDLLPLGIKKSKFVIKANWIDRSQARNVVSCRLWGQMVKSRRNAPPELLSASPNYGAIDGYPIKVYVNGTFHGLYSFNIPKDEDLFGMDADNPLHCVVCGDNNANNDSNSSAFRTATISKDWELEVPDEWPTYDVEEEGQTVTHAVKDNLSNAIAFVINSTDEEFVAGIDDHIDLESAIDYFLLMFMDCGIDSAARNLIMFTYDGGNKWYCSAYDKDMTWGNGPGGTPKYDAQKACPAEYINTNSLLWERLTELFGDEIWERWTELRNTILSAENIKAEFDYFWQDITDADYAADVTAWPTMPQATIDFKARMFSFIDARWTYMDAQINAMRQPVPCTGISLDQSSITFADSTSVTLVATLEPANTTDPVVWTSSNASVASVSGGVVTPIENGTAIITATCGNYSATCAVTVGGMSYTVTLSGTGVTLSPAEDVAPNRPYTGYLTADTGYEIRSVVVTMGGTDITATAYSNGTITIAAVTGNIVVTAETAYIYDVTGLQYRLTSPLVMDGERYVDTGFAYDAVSALTIAIDLVEPNDVTTSGRFILGAMRSGTYTAGWETSNRTFRGVNNRNPTAGLAANAGQRVRAVLRYNPDTNVMSIRSSADDALLGTVEKTNTNSHGPGASTNVSRDAFVNTMYLGGLHGANGLTNATDSGTVNDLRIYTRRWTDAEVARWLGLESLSDVFTDDKDA